MVPMALTPELLTDRLRLRETRAGDFAGCAELWGDEAVVRYIGGTPSTPTEAWARMLRFPGLWALLGYGYWTVEDREPGAFAGQVGLADFKRDLQPAIDGIPEAGWVIAPAFHGRGIASEAMAAVLAWADRELPQQRTCCLIDPENGASIRVAEKLGYAGCRPASLGGAASLLYFRERPGGTRP